ncbi:MAG: MBL fold metallo-hydrolase [Oscillospiraceae bacterium]|nr:MBL fold metallo-hydrolase [Oscillospiraceae bacterium]
MQLLSLALRTVYNTVWAHMRTWHDWPWAIGAALKRIFIQPSRSDESFFGSFFSKKEHATCDAIHFLYTGASDAILLQSGGKFALVDCAEDSHYPAAKSHLAVPGWEDYVVDYVKRVAGGKLEFILATHTHSDHIGGFDTLINDQDIFIECAYVKRYDNAAMHAYERDYWDNEECYTQMLDACAARNIPVIHDLPAESFMLGELQCTIINGEQRRRRDENANSLGLLIECRGQRALLASDINNIYGDEQRMAPQIGRVNLLQAAHHGYDGSTTLPWLLHLRPHTILFTNNMRRVYPTLKLRAKLCANSRFIATGTHGGVVAQFGQHDITYHAIGETTQPRDAQGY